MRITEAMNLNSVLESESRASERMAQLTQMASSGLAVSQPSDDPAAYASIVQRDAGIATVQARHSAATSAAGDLDLAGSVLDQATNLIQKAQSLAVEEANGTQDASSRANAATQVDSLRQQLLALANTKGSTSYLFGGTNSGTPPFDSLGNFAGNDGVTHVEVADGVLAVSNASGAQAFTAAGGRDVFADLQALSSALTSNDPVAIQGSISNLNASQTQLVAAQTDTSERADRLHSASSAMTSAITQMQVALAPVADADAATTISNLEAAQTTYQAALQVNKQILSLSLAQPGG
ncbi:MAG TPA: flagellar hook-associated protein FlgL [Polyangiaceae bacterium]|nr:flagellar hook-associated protein FlgL [Polyangiaceae bacterium]